MSRQRHRSAARRALATAACALLPSLSCWADWQLVLEAESQGRIQPPARAVADPRARDGACVLLSDPDSQVRRTLRGAASEGTSGEVRFVFSLPSAGRYHTWVRGRWHCGCSNSLYAIVSGTPDSASTPERPAEDPLEAYRISPDSPPRIWCWVPAPTAHFEAGEQSLRLVEAGHGTRIDAVFVTDDADARPPGFEAQEQACRFHLRTPDAPAAGNADLVEWEQAGGRNVCRLGSREWGSFRLDVLLKPAATGSALPPWGVAFGLQPDGAAYELHFDAQPRGTCQAALRRNSSGQPTVLATQSVEMSSENPHLVRVVKRTGEIRVSLDGMAVLEADDEELPPGRVALLAEPGPALEFQRAEIHPLAEYDEIFTEGTGAWQALSGEWRPIEDTEADGGPTSYMARPAQPGLSVSRWNLGQEYEIETQLRLTGPTAAGVAFDALQPDAFRALVLCWNGDGSAELRLIERDGSDNRSLLSRQVDGDPAQWHVLKLVRRSATAEAVLDGVPLGKVWLGSGAEGGRSGLLIHGESACLFSTVKARGWTPPGDGTFLLEGTPPESIFSQWTLTEGKLQIVGHPAELRLEPERSGGTASLRLRRRVSGDVKVEAAYLPRRRGSDPEPDPLEKALEAALPPLPGTGRFGIGLSRAEDGQEARYAVLADAASTQDVVITRNGDTIARSKAPKSTHISEIHVYARLCGNTLEGGIVGGPSARAELPAGTPEPSGVAVELLAVNTGPDESPGIVEVELQE